MDAVQPTRRTGPRSLLALTVAAMAIGGVVVFTVTRSTDAPTATDPGAVAAAGPGECSEVSRFRDEDSDPGYSVSWNGAAWGGGTDKLMDRIDAELGGQVGTLACAPDNPDPDKLQLVVGDAVHRWSGIDPRCMVAVPHGDTVLLLEPNAKPAGVDCEHRDPMPGTEGIRMRMFLHCGLPPVELNGVAWTPRELGTTPRKALDDPGGSGVFLVDADGVGATFVADAGWSARYRLSTAADDEWMCA